MPSTRERRVAGSHALAAAADHARWADRRDLALLLPTFPDLKRDAGPVVDQLHTAGATPEVLAVRHEVAAHEIRPVEADEEW